VVKLFKILSEVMIKTSQQNLNEWNSVLFEESELFLELSNPNNSYQYTQVQPNIWEFEDRYKNTLGVRFDPSSKYFESYFLMKDLDGNDIRVYDYEGEKYRLDPTSFQGGSDIHRSDTICKILLEDVVPYYLINKSNQLIKLHPISEYRFNIFLKCAEIVEEKYPQTEIKKVGKEIWLINKQKLEI